MNEPQTAHPTEDAPFRSKSRRGETGGSPRDVIIKASPRLPGGMRRNNILLSTLQPTAYPAPVPNMKMNQLWGGLSTSPQQQDTVQRVLLSGARKRRRSEWLERQNNKKVFKMDPAEFRASHNLPRIRQHLQRETLDDSAETNMKFANLQLRQGKNVKIRFRSLNLRQELTSSQQGPRELSSSLSSRNDDLFKFQPSLAQMQPQLLVLQQPNTQLEFQNKRDTGTQAIQSQSESNEPTSLLQSNMITSRRGNQQEVKDQRGGSPLRRGSLAISHFESLEAEIHQKRRYDYNKRKELQALGKDRGRDSPLPNEKSYKTYGFTNRRVEQIFKRLQRDREIADPRSLDRKRRILARSVELTTEQGVLKKIPGMDKMKQVTITNSTFDKTKYEDTVANVKVDDELVKVEEEEMTITDEPEIRHLQYEYDLLQRQRQCAGKSELFGRSPQEAFLQAMVGHTSAAARHRREWNSSCGAQKPTTTKKLSDARKLKRPQQFARPLPPPQISLVQPQMPSMPINQYVDGAATKTTLASKESSFVAAPARVSADGATSSALTRPIMEVLPIDLGDESRLNTMVAVDAGKQHAPFTSIHQSGIMRQTSAGQRSSGSSPRRTARSNQKGSAGGALDVLKMLKHESTKAAKTVAKRKREGNQATIAATRMSLSGLPTTERKGPQVEEQEKYQSRDRSITPSDVPEPPARGKVLVHFDAMPQANLDLNDREPSRSRTPGTHHQSPNGRPITQKIGRAPKANDAQSRRKSGQTDGMQAVPESNFGNTLRFDRPRAEKRATQMRIASEAGDRSRARARDSNETPNNPLSGDCDNSTPTKLVLGDTLHMPVGFTADGMPLADGVSPKTEEIINTNRSAEKSNENRAAELVQLHQAVIMAKNVPRDSRNVVIVNRASANRTIEVQQEDSLDKELPSSALEPQLQLDLQQIEGSNNLLETSMRGGGSSDSYAPHLAPLSQIYNNASDGKKQAINSQHNGTAAQGYEMSQVERRQESTRRTEVTEPPTKEFTRQEFEQINCKLQNPLQIQKMPLNEPPLSPNSSPRRQTTKRKSEDRARQSRVDSRKRSPRSKISVNMGHGRFKRDQFAKNLDIIATQSGGSPELPSGRREVLQMVLTDGFSTIPATALPASVGATALTHDSHSRDRAGPGQEQELNQRNHMTVERKNDKDLLDPNSPGSDKKAMDSGTSRVVQDISSRKAMQSHVDFHLAGSRLKGTTSGDAPCHSDDDEIVKQDSEVYSQPGLGTTMQLKASAMDGDERMAAAYGRAAIGGIKSRPNPIELASIDRYAREGNNVGDVHEYHSPQHAQKSNGGSHQVVASAKEQGLAPSATKQGLEMANNASNLNSFGSARRKIVNFRPKHMNQGDETSRLRQQAAAASHSIEPMLLGQVPGSVPGERTSEVDHARTRNSMMPGLSGLHGESVLLHPGWRTSEQSSPSLEHKKVEIKQILSLRPGQAEDDQQRLHQISVAQDQNGSNYLANSLQHGAERHQCVHIYNSRAIVRQDGPVACALDLMEPSFSPATQRDISHSADMRGDSVTLDPRLTLLSVDDKSVLVEVEQHDPAAWPKFWAGADANKRDTAVEALLKGQSRAEAREAALKEMTGRSSLYTPRATSPPSTEQQQLRDRILDAAFQHLRESKNEREQTQVLGKSLNISSKLWSNSNAPQRSRMQTLNGQSAQQESQYYEANMQADKIKETEHALASESPSQQLIKKPALVDAVQDAVSLGEASGAHPSQDDFFPMPLSASGAAAAARGRRVQATIYSGGAVKRVNFVGGRATAEPTVVQGGTLYDKARMSPCKCIVKTNMNMLNALTRSRSPKSPEIKRGRGARPRRGSKLTRVQIDRAVPGEATSFSADSKDDGSHVLQRRQDMPSASPEQEGNVSQSFEASAAALMLRTAEARVAEETGSNQIEHAHKVSKSPMTAGGTTSKMHRGTGGERAGTVYNPDLPNKSLMGHYMPTRQNVNELSHIGDKGSGRAGTTQAVGYDSRAPDWPRDEMSEIMGRPPSPGSLLCSTDDDGQAVLESFRRQVQLHRGPRQQQRYVTFGDDEPYLPPRADTANAFQRDQEFIQTLIKDHESMPGAKKWPNKQRTSIDLAEIMRHIKRGLHPQSSHRDSAARSLQSRGVPITSLRPQRYTALGASRGTTMPGSRSKNRFLSNAERQKLNDTYRRTNFSSVSNTIAEELAGIPNEVLARAHLEALPNFGLFSRSIELRAAQTVSSGEKRYSAAAEPASPARKHVATKPMTQSTSPVASGRQSHSAADGQHKTGTAPEESFVRHQSLLSRGRAIKTPHTNQQMDQRLDELSRQILTQSIIPYHYDLKINQATGTQDEDFPIVAPGAVQVHRPVRQIYVNQNLLVRERMRSTPQSMAGGSLSAPVEQADAEQIMQFYYRNISSKRVNESSRYPDGADGAMRTGNTSVVVGEANLSVAASTPCNIPPDETHSQMRLMQPSLAKHGGDYADLDGMASSSPTRKHDKGLTQKPHDIMSQTSHSADKANPRSPLSTELGPQGGASRNEDLPLSTNNNQTLDSLAADNPPKTKASSRNQVLTKLNAGKDTGAADTLKSQVDDEDDKTQLPENGSPPPTANSRQLASPTYAAKIKLPTHLAEINKVASDLSALDGDPSVAGLVPVGDTSTAKRQDSPISGGMKESEPGKQAPQSRRAVGRVTELKDASANVDSTQLGPPTLRDISMGSNTAVTVATIARSGATVIANANNHVQQRLAGHALKSSRKQPLFQPVPLDAEEQRKQQLERQQLDDLLSTSFDRNLVQSMLKQKSKK